MPRPPTRTWALLAVAVLAAGLGLGAAAVGAGHGRSTDGQLGATTLTASPGPPFDAIVPAETGRVLVGRLGNPREDPRAGPLAALVFGMLLIPALRPALGTARVLPRSPWLSPGRRSVAGRAPPRPRLV